MEYVSPIRPVKCLIPAWPSSFVLDEPEFTVVKLNPLAHITWLTEHSCVCVFVCVCVCVHVCVQTGFI